MKWWRISSLRGGRRLRTDVCSGRVDGVGHGGVEAGWRVSGEDRQIAYWGVTQGPASAETQDVISSIAAPLVTLYAEEPCHDLQA